MYAEAVLNWPGDLVLAYMSIKIKINADTLKIGLFPTILYYRSFQGDTSFVMFWRRIFMLFEP